MVANWWTAAGFLGWCLVHLAGHFIAMAIEIFFFLAAFSQCSFQRKA
jgi:hypothetical protein